MTVAPGSAGVVARGLVKDFPGVRALDGLDLEVPPGELYGLVGPNGSGKTTLIRILTGLEPQTAGEVSVLGHAPGRLPHQVGYMPQEEAVYPDLSVIENLRFFAGLFGVRQRAQRMREVLELVRLWEARDRIVQDLSGGMRRRVSLAITLTHEPLALFLDEPTAGVDPLLRREFWAAFRARAAAGASILITTHQLEEARHCDRVGLLWRGRLIREDAPARLLEEARADSLEDAFAAAVQQEEERSAPA